MAHSHFKASQRYEGIIKKKKKKKKGVVSETGKIRKRQRKINAALETK